MSIETALASAADILQTEANQLAHLVDDKAFAPFNYRVEIAVRTEMTRLRTIADALVDAKSNQVLAGYLTGKEHP